MSEHVSSPAKHKVYSRLLKYCSVTCTPVENVNLCMLCIVDNIIMCICETGVCVCVCVC